MIVNRVCRVLTLKVGGGVHRIVLMTRMLLLLLMLLLLQVLLHLLGERAAVMRRHQVRLSFVERVSRVGIEVRRAAVIEASVGLGGTVEVMVMRGRGGGRVRHRRRIQRRISGVMNVEGIHRRRVGRFRRRRRRGRRGRGGKVVALVVQPDSGLVVRMMLVMVMGMMTVMRVMIVGGGGRRQTDWRRCVTHRPVDVRRRYATAATATAIGRSAAISHAVIITADGRRRSGRRWRVSSSAAETSPESAAVAVRRQTVVTSAAAHVGGGHRGAERVDVGGSVILVVVMMRVRMRVIVV